MDYEKIYFQIIFRASLRKLDTYTERHHIVPKCLGGTNAPENLIDLTAREHFICHRILTKIYPENKSLRYAYWMMCNALKKGRDYKVSSRAYNEAKEGYINNIRGDGNHNKKEENRIKISRTLKNIGHKPPSPKGKVRSEEHKRNLSNSLKGRKLSEEHNLKNSQSHKGLQVRSKNGMYKLIDLKSFREDVLNGYTYKQLYAKYNFSQTTVENRLEEIFNERKLRNVRKLFKISK